MIVDQTSKAVNTTVLSTAEFTTQQSPMLFKLLYSSMYKDKEKIVLQELAANALDAHIAVGLTDTPIEITLPSTANPELVVKDVGIGMSLETVTEVYPVYGASSKRETNELIGGFGLGSKSPFALSESFILETTHKGVTTTVSCFLDNGLPKFTIFTSENVGKEDGTTVRVPISDATVQYRLRAHADNLFILWNTPPKVLVGNTRTVLTPLESTENYTLVSTRALDSSSRYTRLVSVGPFIYEVPYGIDDRIDADLKNFGAQLRTLNTRRNSGPFSEVRAIPRFEVGDIELSPTREAIEDTPENAKAYEKKLQTIYEGVASADKALVTLEWYQRFIKTLDSEGLFTPETADTPAVFAGIDPAALEDLLEELVGKTPTVLSAYWRDIQGLSLDHLREEIQKMPRDDALKLLDTSRFPNARYMRSLSLPQVSSPSGVILHPAKIAYNPLVSITEVEFAGLHNAIFIAQKAFLNDSTNTTSRVSMTRHGKPSITGHSIPTYSDIRLIPTFLGEYGSRQKLYNWWREKRVEWDADLVLVKDPEAYNTLVEWLDKHFPLQEHQTKAPTYSAADIEEAWKRRVVEARKTRQSSKRTSVATQYDPEEVMGYLLTYTEKRKPINLADLEALMDDKKLKRLFIVPRLFTRDQSALRPDGKVALKNRWEGEVKPVDILGEVATLVMLKRYTNRKDVKSVLEKLGKKIDIEHLADTNGSFNLRMANYLRDHAEYQKAVKIAERNGLLIRTIVDSYTTTSTGLIQEYPKMFARIKGSKLPPVIFCERQSYFEVQDTVSAVIPTLSDHALSQVLLLRYQIEKRLPTRGTLSTATTKALCDAFNSYKKGIQK